MSTRIGQFFRSNALGLIAIFIALSGTTYAVTHAPKNSVVAKSIKKGAVKNSKLAAGAVTGDKVADASLTGADIANDSVTGQQVNEASLTGVDAATLGGVAPSALQSRVTGSCTLGRTIKAIDASGAVDCSGTVGVVVQGGVTPSVVFGHGVTVTRTGMGQYTLDWTDAGFDKNPAPLVQPILIGTPPPQTSITGFCSGETPGVFCAGVGPQQVRLAVRFANLVVSTPCAPNCSVATTDVDPPFFSVLLASAPSSG